MHAIVEKIVEDVLDSIMPFGLGFTGGFTTTYLGHQVGIIALSAASPAVSGMFIGTMFVALWAPADKRWMPFTVAAVALAFFALTMNAATVGSLVLTGVVSAFALPNIGLILFEIALAAGIIRTDHGSDDPSR